MIDSGAAAGWLDRAAAEKKCRRARARQRCAQLGGARLSHARTCQRKWGATSAIIVHLAAPASHLVVMERPLSHRGRAASLGGVKSVIPRPLLRGAKC